MLENERVSHVHKGDVETDPSNFRPISVLPIYTNENF